MKRIFDTHSHYDDHAFDKDRKELLSGLLEQGVGTVMAASAAARNMPQILQMTREYEFVYGSAGLHPCETYGCGDNLGKPVMHCLPAPDAPGAEDPYRKVREVLDLYRGEEMITADWKAGDREETLIRAMLQQPKIQAVGEIGLDYHYDDTRKEIQKDWFVRQIAIAREYDVPIFIHSRDAAAQTLDIVKAENAGEAGGIVHCFSYSREMAAAYVDLNFLIGIGGVVTYKNAKKLKEVVRFLPLDVIVLETDCPYLAPAPFRGKRNDSSLIRYTAQAVAELKGVSVQEVIAVTEENARRVYRIADTKQ